MNRKTVYRIGLLLAALIVAFVAGLQVAMTPQQTGQVERDTLSVIDTIPYYMPVPKDSTVIRYVTKTLPLAPKDEGQDTEKDTIGVTIFATSVESDSAAVVLPIVQKRYESDNYRAYVSGYEASLDSIFVYPRTTIISERSNKSPNRWHIGVTAGYGYSISSKQTEPFIGIGLTYSFIGF